MGEDTLIEWADATWNPWIGCTKVSAGCDHCYMYREQRRYGRTPEVVTRTKPTTFTAPFKWESRLVFACSWSDFFHPAADPWRHEAWNVVRATKKHDYLILTKRPELIEARLPNDWYVGFQHVTLGVTVEDQAAVDRVCLFRRVMGPAVRLFVSVEPIIGPVDFSGLEHDISWIIVAGESGPNRRRPETAWVEGIAAWCARNAVPYFFKRWADEREARGHKEACERREWPTWIRGRAGSAC